MSFDSSVQFIEVGIVDHAYGRYFVDDETERDAECREGVYEVRCAVDGIDDEGWGIREDHARLVGFFADEGVCWVGFSEPSRDHELDFLVGFGYEICG